LDRLTGFPATPATQQRSAGIGAVVMGATTWEWLLHHAGMLDEPEARHQAWVFTPPRVPPARRSPSSAATWPPPTRAAGRGGEKDGWLAGGGTLAGQLG
jgi:dihydrofolate reductase